MEAIWFELLPPKTKKILVGAIIFKPLNSDATIFTGSLGKMLDKLTTNETETILLGDFNFNYIVANTATMKFKRLTSLFHLKQLITEPTRITENSRSLIDLFLTSRPELYVSSVIPIGFSDHYAIAGFRKLHRIKLPPPLTIQLCSKLIYITPHGTY